MGGGRGRGARGTVQAGTLLTASWMVRTMRARARGAGMPKVLPHTETLRPIRMAKAVTRRARVIDNSNIHKVKVRDMNNSSTIVETVKNVITKEELVRAAPPKVITGELVRIAPRAP